MLLIPAIDIKDGRCVRLKQGRMDTATEFNSDPSQQARLWEQAGARRIHVVDLNGSVEGRPVNLRAVRGVIDAVSAPVQLGGGIRDLETLEIYFEAGIAVAILGTAAIRDPEFAERALTHYPGRVAIGIDALRGHVAVQGWTHTTAVEAGRLAAHFDRFGPESFIYTDISRDGMMRGPNFEETAAFAAAVGSPVILSGGVSTMRDVIAAAALRTVGVTGVIVGRALYDGAIDAAEAIRVLEAD